MAKEMEVWPRQLIGERDIPAEFADECKKYVFDSEEKPYLVFAPAKTYERMEANPKLLVLFDDRVIFHEKGTDGNVKKEFLFGKINFVEQGRVLVYSWIKVAGVTAEGKYETYTFEFDAVVQELFNPVTEKIRRTVNSIVNAETKDVSALEAIIKANFKFMNYGRDAVLTGETIKNICYQDAIIKKVENVGNVVVDVAHIFVLTDKELIAIKEEDILISKYSGTRIFIPLKNISDISSIVDEGNIFVTITTVYDEVLKFVFTTEKRKELVELIAVTGKSKSGTNI